MVVTTGNASAAMFTKAAVEEVTGAVNIAKDDVTVAWISSSASKTKMFKVSHDLTLGRGKERRREEVRARGAGSSRASRLFGAKRNLARGR